MTLSNYQDLLIVLAILYLLYIPNVSSNPKVRVWEDSEKFPTYQPGQNYKGLSKVKNYFHNLGYIPMPSSNLDDNFDDNFVSAIQKYQNKYKLNTTGKLDHDTVRHLMEPRCGYPDIINKFNAKSLHTVSHYKLIGNTPKRWPVGTKELTYSFLPQNKLSGDYKTAIVSGLNRWTPVTNIKFKQGNSYGSSKIKIAFYSGDHKDGSPFDGKNGVAAHAYPPTDGRIHFDNDEVWVASGDVTKAPDVNAVDLESVAVHEFGHILGLDHSDNQTAIMFFSLSTRTKKVNLTEDDIKGIKTLYNIKP